MDQVIGQLVLKLEQMELPIIWLPLIRYLNIFLLNFDSWMHIAQMHRLNLCPLRLHIWIKIMNHLHQPFSSSFMNSCGSWKILFVTLKCEIENIWPSILAEVGDRVDMTHVSPSPAVTRHLHPGPWPMAPGSLHKYWPDWISHLSGVQFNIFRPLIDFAILFLPSIKIKTKDI